MRVTAIRTASDNYAYWVERLSGTSGFLIDPGSAAEINSFLKTRGLPKPLDIFVTHNHPDHCGGIVPLLAEETLVYAGTEDAKEVVGCTNRLKDNDTLNLDGLKIVALHTPCHTIGHIVYAVSVEPEVPNQPLTSIVKHNDARGHWVEYSGGLNRVLFTGDTLFVGGCGRFSEGLPQDLHCFSFSFASSDMELFDALLDVLIEEIKVLHGSGRTLKLSRLN